LKIKPFSGIIYAKIEDRRQKTEDRRQKAEDRRQKTEGRKQKTEDRSLPAGGRTEYRGFTP